MKKITALAIVGALAISIAPAATIAVAADTKNPYGTSTVDPAGPNEVIFTVAKGSKVKSSVINIYEPFLKKRQSFTVIPMKTFFNLVGISGNEKVFTTALNDYVYTNTATNFNAANAYIAIKRNGTDIPYDQGGPIRLVFADNSKWAKNLDAWNWSLASITTK
jgi:hypothetical protein